MISNGIVSFIIRLPVYSLYTGKLGYGKLEKETKLSGCIHLYKTKVKESGKEKDVDEPARYMITEIINIHSNFTRTLLVSVMQKS